MKILITGSSGFIGSALIKKIKNYKNFKLLLLSRKNHITKNMNIKYLKGDLNNLNLIKNKIEIFNPEILIHLAWEGIPDFSKNISKKNYSNSMKLIKFLIKKTRIKKIIISGSCFEKKKSEKFKTFFSKYKNNLLVKVRKLSKNNKISFLWLRLFYVYGEKQKSSSLLPSVFKSLKKGNTIKLQKPFHRNDFIHLDDVIEAVVKSIKLRKYVISDLDIGTGKTTLIKDLVKKVGYNLKKKITLNENNKEINLKNVANLKKTYNILKWKPKIDINLGIKMMLKKFK